MSNFCPHCGGALEGGGAPPQQQQQGGPTMPFGKHRGVLLTQVPAEYLRWLWDKAATDDKGGLKEPLKSQIAEVLRDEKTGFDGKSQKWTSPQGQDESGGWPEEPPKAVDDHYRTDDPQQTDVPF